ncbi:tyrosine-type recombinase/integrase [Novosphingobium beihaiensis]|uniref:Integrase arm-type DNA-binding domain-containing protein n=1 Tax=Novosphingobium beihaiensis TaxID=2930389 RepID=A0ABT0BQA0_9SPHN|nr:integrase arm-type DNA-binding domain-containing protein [Novosphingobium beihaiensis]MCJ2187224.1 integrase arm-type DNA-binding domain-containing protein [Novosphingobium beihaiensis]
MLAIGAYPEIGLGEARRRQEEARELIALGKDPSREKQRDKVRARIQAADTFAAICDEYCETRRRGGSKGWAPATAKRSEYLLSLVCGSIGKFPIGEIEPPDVLTAIRRIEGKGKLESARRSLQLAGAVFCYAVATARLASDP